jgi:hypothetical protein
VWAFPSPGNPVWKTAQVFLFAVLGFELRTYTLSYSASPFFVMGIFFFFFFEKGCIYMIEMQSDITYMPVPLPHPSQRVLGKPQAVITKMT